MPTPIPASSSPPRPVSAVALFLALVAASFAPGCRGTAPDRTASTAPPAVAGAPRDDLAADPTGAGAAGSDAPDALVDEVADRYRLAAEQRGIQAERLYQEGRTFHLAGDESRALTVLDAALRLDPAHAGARDLRARLAGAGGAGRRTDEVTVRETARRRAALEQRRAEVLGLVKDGDTAAANGDPKTAIRHYRDALLLLEMTPSAGDPEAVAKRLRALGQQ